jgi:hypothetical protein
MLVAVIILGVLLGISIWSNIYLLRFSFNKLQEITYFNGVDEITQRSVALRSAPIRTTRRKKPVPEETPEFEGLDFGNLPGSSPFPAITND